MAVKDKYYNILIFIIAYMIDLEQKEKLFNICDKFNITVIICFFIKDML